MSGPNADLAEFVAELEYADLPAEVAERVKAITIDAIASAIAGRHGEETAQVQRLAEAVTGQGSSTILGGPRTFSPAGAALLNGYQVTAVTVCDVFAPALCHVTPQVVPPALAMAEQRGASGRDLLAAVAAGLETTVRVGMATNYPEFRKRGWHSPGVIGPFGGAAAAGSLLNLSAEQQRNAFGLAGSQAAGTFAHWGTPTIKFHQSRGSLSGLLAANLAAQDFRSAEEIFTNPDGGLLHAYSDGGNPEALTDGLGSDWRLEGIALRRWPAASSVQTMITSLFALLETHDIKVDDVAQVRVSLSETVYKMHGSLPWEDKFRAQLSAPYLTAIILHDRQCWLEQFTPARFANAEVDTFAREKVHVSADPTLEGTASIVEVELADGTVHRDDRAIAKGDPRDPLSLDEIVAKFREASTGLVDTEPALSELLDLDNTTDASSAIAALAGA